MATLGIAIIAGTVSVAALFMRLTDVLLVPQSEITGLTPSAQETLERRQYYASVLTIALPWFVVVGCALGLALSTYGLVGWARRQQVADELEDIARDKGRTELRRLSDAERIARIEREVDVTVAQDEAASISVGPETGQTEQQRVGSQAPSSAADLKRRHAELMERTIGVELELATKAEDALRETHTIEIGVEAKIGGSTRSFDIVAAPRKANEKYILFEVKFVRSVKNLGNALDNALLAVVSGAELFREEAIPVAVVVCGEPISDQVRERANRHASRLASTFSNPPSWIIEDDEGLASIDGVALLRRLGLN